MALNSNVVREQNEKLAAFAHSRTFVWVAAALPGLFVATSETNGSLMGVVTGVSILGAWIFSSLVPRFAGRFSALPIALMLNAALMVGVGFGVRVADPVAYQDFGMYLPLTGVSGMAAVYIARGCAVPAGEDRASFGVRDMVFSLAGAFACLVLVGFFNEVLGTGTIFGMTVPGLVENPISIFGKPAGSLLVLALLAAFAQACEDVSRKKGGER